MDPELQGTLASLSWPHVFVADSLAMGEAAAKMAQSGEIDAIICMGVDFMSESVRATLDSNPGKGGKETNPIPVYRLSEKKIGCSLAEAAERQAYNAFLEKASKGPPLSSLPPSPSLHVVYINTSLVTKALSHEILPTITCTSSNVLSTLLSAYSQIPNLNIYYGPDTYMGANLESLLQRLAALPPSLPSSLEIVQKLHPAHTPETIKELLPRFHYFKVRPSLPPFLPPSLPSFLAPRPLPHSSFRSAGEIHTHTYLLIFSHSFLLKFPPISSPFSNQNSKETAWSTTSLGRKSQNGSSKIIRTLIILRI